MSCLFIGRGKCTLGHTTRYADGNVVSHTDAKFETDKDGGCIAICDLDPDTMQPTSGVQVFGDWDASGYLRVVVEKLGPGRPVNIPDFRNIIHRAKVQDGVNLCEMICEYCGHCSICGDCVVTTWKEAENAESE